MHYLLVISADGDHENMDEIESIQEQIQRLKITFQQGFDPIILASIPLDPY